MFPEIVTYEKLHSDPNFKELEGTYYLAVFGYVQSTFSIVYYTETEDGKQSTIKLLTG